MLREDDRQVEPVQLDVASDRRFPTDIQLLRDPERQREVGRLAESELQLLARRQEGNRKRIGLGISWR